MLEDTPRGTFRSLYVRAATSRVLGWGHGLGHQDHGVGNMPARVPETQGLCVKQVTDLLVVHHEDGDLMTSHVMMIV